MFVIRQDLCKTMDIIIISFKRITATFGVVNSDNDSTVVFLFMSLVVIIIISNLSNDRSKASSKMIPPHSAI